MDQVTADIQLVYDNGNAWMKVNYSAECGCRWCVDMWGNVRTVAVCRKCNAGDFDWERQLSLNLPQADPESPATTHSQRLPAPRY